MPRVHSLVAYVECEWISVKQKRAKQEAPFPELTDVMMASGPTRPPTQCLPSRHARSDLRMVELLKGISSPERDHRSLQQVDATRARLSQAGAILRELFRELV